MPFGVYMAIGFTVAITVVVFVHEMGHFLVARWCGVRIDAFSIGFGPELVGRTDRKGTRWRISAIPVGGYVKFYGDLNAASAGTDPSVARMSDAERAVTLWAQPPSKRAAVFAAGPIANFLLALLIFAALNYAQGVPSGEARIGTVLPDRPAAAAGFRPGDVVKAVDGRPVPTFEAMRDIVARSPGTPLRFSVERHGEVVDLTATPRAEAVQDRPPIGLLGVNAAMVPTTPQRAMADAGEQCWSVVANTGRFLGDVFRGRGKSDQLSGPIGIAYVAGQAASLGAGTLLGLIGLISVSIGLTNLLPIPILDGGHLLYLAFEVVRGRPLSTNAQEIGFRVGLAVVVTLMLFATTNDVTHIVQRLFHG